ALEIRNPGHTVVKVTVRVKPIDLADPVIGAYHERRPLADKDVRDRLNRCHRLVALVPGAIDLKRFDRFGGIDVSVEGHPILAHSLVGGRAFGTGGAAENTVLVVAP